MLIIAILNYGEILMSYYGLNNLYNKKPKVYICFGIEKQSFSILSKQTLKGVRFNFLQSKKFKSPF
jgi:hypothetical protein